MCAEKPFIGRIRVRRVGKIGRLKVLEVGGKAKAKNKRWIEKR